MSEDVNYYTLNVEELPRGDVLRWCRENLSSSLRSRVTVTELKNDAYYVHISKGSVAVTFEAWLQEKEVPICTTTASPPAQSERAARASSRKGGIASGSDEGILDAFIDGIAGIIDAMLNP